MKRHTVALLLIGALACSDSNAPAVHQFAILPALDTVAAGFSITFVAQRKDSSVDAWQLSDSSAARIDSSGNGRALVQTLAAGTVTITATRLGDSGQATLVILPPPPPPPDTTHHASFAIRPALDTVKVGEMVTFHLNVWKVDDWFLSDSALAGIDGVYMPGSVPSDTGWFNEIRVVARAKGTVTLTATHGGDTGRATLVIREPQPGEWESIDLGLVDTATSAAPTAIADDGTIIGYFTKEGYYWRGFVYKDGALRKLPSLGGIEIPEIIGPSGRIAGRSGGMVLVWDTPDTPPRHLALKATERADVLGLNQRGDVLFTATTRCGRGGCRSPGDIAVTARAVLWRDGVSVDLGSLGDSTVESWTEAKAWNAKGQIVGTSQVRNREFVGMEQGDNIAFFHPFLWENGVMRDLGVLAPLPCESGATATDCSWGVAVDISANGVIVGTANSANGSATAFIWENGIMRDLGLGPGTEAVAINDRGQVLVRTAFPFKSFLWENGQTQSVGDEYYAVALGPNGEVIGTGPGYSGHAFFWKAGVLTMLGEGGALAVNGRDEVVGWSGKRAMLWRKKQ
jgi:probable HAF family extracellular repeat protein